MKVFMWSGKKLVANTAHSGSLSMRFGETSGVQTRFYNACSKCWNRYHLLQLYSVPVL